MSTQEKGNMSNFLNDTDLKPDTALPFSKKKQSAILGHCLIEPKFFLQARNLIQPNWFADSQASKVFTAMLAWFEHHGRPGTLEEILHGPEITSEEAALRPKLVNTIHSAVNDTNDFRLDALTVELTKWLQSRLFYTGVHTSQKSYNTGRLEDAYLQMEKVMKGIREATFLNEREESFGKWRSDFELAQFESQRGLTFGRSPTPR
jgi:hypothetical protein